ncbi:MAG: hypothetical protein JNK15_06615 [Planctomycetes bacterium]|nr:hypothetical protein [Planctomycetota bacterium]
MAYHEPAVGVSPALAVHGDYDEFWAGRDYRHRGSAAFAKAVGFAR